MMIEKSGSIELRDISIEELAPEVREMVPEIKEMAAGMVRVKHLYRSALKIAVTQMEILDEEFAGLYDHSPIHHIEHRIKTLESAAKKLKRRGYDLTIDNIYAHIQDMAGVRVICNYLDDIYYLRSLLTRTESFRVIREADYIKEPKETGTCGPVWSTSCGISPTVTGARRRATACGCAAMPFMRWTGRCRTSIRVNRRSTRTESYIKKEAAVPPLFCPCGFYRNDSYGLPDRKSSCIIKI